MLDKILSLVQGDRVEIMHEEFSKNLTVLGRGNIPISPQFHTPSHRNNIINTF